MPPYLSEDLDISENYTRGELCDLMKINYNDEIESGVYKPRNYSSIILFSTIENSLQYINGRLSDTSFIYSANRYFIDPEIISHQRMHKELLLFVRMDIETGFYYFGRCNYSHEHNSQRSRFPLYCIELLDTKFSNVKGIVIPEVIN